MLDHPSSEELALYRSRALTPDLFLSIHRHIAACEECSAQSPAEASVKQDYEILMSAVTPDPHEAEYHLTSAELSAYVNETLDDVDSESAASHLEVCADCQHTAEQLRNAILSTPLPVVGHGLEKEQSHRPWAMTFLTFGIRPLRFATLLVIMLGVVLLGWLLLRGRLAQPPTRDISANANTTPASSPADHSPAPNQNGVQASVPTDGSTPKPDSTNVPTPNDISEDIPEAVSPDLRRAIMAALTTQRLEKPRILTELGGTPGRLMSDSGNGLPFRLLSPVGKVLLEQRPTFNWQPLAGVNSYLVTIADDQLNEVATSGQLTNTSWRIPIGLKQGATYSWQVTAFKDGQRIISPVMPAPQAKFRIADRSQREELGRMKREIPNYHLGLGVLYTRAGLLEDAEREFEALAKDKSQSEIGARLLKQVRSMKE
ncbi:MAG TPA: hypothetical protein VGN86_09290 [Pyrinomonadaceae bacterium]|nr:hypothetical protein [Pyrinomonadaceae bacterium]